jgi:hypothetical protein
MQSLNWAFEMSYDGKFMNDAAAASDSIESPGCPRGHLSDRKKTLRIGFRRSIKIQRFGLNWLDQMRDEARLIAPSHILIHAITGESNPNQTMRFFEGRTSGYTLFIR